MMVVQLEITHKKKTFLKVNVYTIVGKERLFDCVMSGTIPQILSELEKRYDEPVIIQRSIFSGWY
jgi:hypothetical protein